MACSHGCCESNRAHWLSVSISPAATPTRTNAEYRRVTTQESRWERDMPAYKRLRDEGLQPPGIDGAADLEARATDRFEVETGVLAPDASAIEIVKDIQAAVDE